MNRLVLLVVMLVAGGCRPAAPEPAAPPAKFVAAPAAGDRVVVGRLEGQAVPIAPTEDAWRSLAEAASESGKNIANLVSAGVLSVIPGGEKGTVLRSRPDAALVILDCGQTGWVPLDLIADDADYIPPGQLSPYCRICGTQPPVKPGPEGLAFKSHAAAKGSSVECPGSQQPLKTYADPTRR